MILLEFSQSRFNPMFMSRVLMMRSNFTFYVVLRGQYDDYYLCDKVVSLYLIFFLGLGICFNM